MKEIKKKKEKMTTNKGRLGGYDLMIVSKYFNTIEDFMHMELASPKARNNMEKFHFNPIALDQWSRQFWKHLQTFHVYNKEDEHFPEETFFKRIIHYDIDWEEYSTNKKENEIYKNVVLSETTAKRLHKIPEGWRLLFSI